MKDYFNEEYFKSVNYIAYLDKEGRYKKLAEEFDIQGLLNKGSKILDYGAAVGFLTNALKELGYNCDGYDISDWATSEAKRRYNIEYITEPVKYDCLIALDVFEHMLQEDIIKCLEMFRPNDIIVRIPVSTNGGKNFYLGVSNLDPTHINCKEKEQWLKFFEEFGYINHVRLNLFSIYDSKGVLCYKVSKQLK